MGANLGCKMKSMIIKNLGTQLSPANLPEPVPDKNQILLKVLSCGLNFADTLLMEGKYQHKPVFPFAPGLEICGIIEKIHNTSSKFKIGERVVALVKHGGLAEKVIADETACFSIPKNMDSNEAAGFLIAYGTGYVSLKERARLKKGENLLVLGASGGVGTTAVELGVALGANVIAVASALPKLDVAKNLGASYLLKNNDPNLVKKIKSIGGADVIYDPVGGNLSEESFKSANQFARIIPVGFASGRVPSFPLNIVMIKNINVIGVHWSAYKDISLKKFRKSNNDLIQLWKDKKLNPLVSNIFRLEDANMGLDILRNRRAKGKVVIDMGI